MLTLLPSNLEKAFQVNGNALARYFTLNDDRPDKV